jgi:hypothetical protein
MEVADSDKRSSLPQFGINFAREKFHDYRPLNLGGIWRNLTTNIYDQNLQKG